MTEAGQLVHQAFLALWFCALVVLGIATGPWSTHVEMRQPALFLVSAAIAAVIVDAALR